MPQLGRSGTGSPTAGLRSRGLRRCEGRWRRSRRSTPCKGGGAADGGPEGAFEGAGEPAGAHLHAGVAEVALLVDVQEGQAGLERRRCGGRRRSRCRCAGRAPCPGGRGGCRPGSSSRPPMRSRMRALSSSGTGVWLTGSAAHTRPLGSELPPPSLVSSLPSAGMVPKRGSVGRRDGGRIFVGGVDHLSEEEESP